MNQVGLLIFWKKLGKCSQDLGIICCNPVAGFQLSSTTLFGTDDVINSFQSIGWIGLVGIMEG